MKDVTAKGVGSFADDVFLGLDDARGEPGERGYYLKGRARRIKASRCAVVERLIRSLDEISPDLRVWLEGELVGVEARIGDHDQYAAGGDIERYQRGAAIAGEAVEREGLHVAVEGEDHVPTRLARRRAKLADDAAMGVDLILDRSGFAAQLGIEALLDAGLADAEPRNAHDFVLVDLALSGHADIADYVRDAASSRVVAVRCPVGLHAGQ